MTWPWHKPKHRKSKQEQEEAYIMCADLQPMPEGETGYMCTLPYVHDGDHAAEDTTTGEIYAVWRRETLV